MEGTLFVDDIYVSCYASFKHDVAHFALKPLRWWPEWYANSADNNFVGTLSYVENLKCYTRTYVPVSLQRLINIV